MPGPKTTPENVALPWIAKRSDSPNAARTERIVRETWRHYYVAQLAEAQFGPASLEASIARNRALTSYRELRGALRDLDPYYRAPDSTGTTPSIPPRHLKLVSDDPDPDLPASDS
ncbi:MAG TPA: hypothetical protein VIG47_02345 [Gemmatimonadaceae bacterium]|jgi:hypothetical protein